MLFLNEKYNDLGISLIALNSSLCMIYHKVAATIRTELKVARSMDANKRTEANYL